MERLDGNVRAMQPALQKRPEVFQAVGVNLAIDVLNRMVYNAMLKFIQAFV